MGCVKEVIQMQPLENIAKLAINLQYFRDHFHETARKRRSRKYLVSVSRFLRICMITQVCSELSIVIITSGCEAIFACGQAKFEQQKCQVDQLSQYHEFYPTQELMLSENSFFLLKLDPFCVSPKFSVTLLNFVRKKFVLHSTM